MRRGIPKPLLIAALAIGGLALWLANRRYDRWRYPWADARSGRPVLLGTWVGQLTTGGGRPRVVFMDVVREQSSSGRSCRACEDGIEGTTLSCDERGRVWRYRLDGTPRNRAASKMQGGIIPDPTPGPDGLTLSSFRGGWDGANALDLEVEFHWRRGPSAISSTADPDTKGFVPLPLRRGTEADFRARCQRIRGPAIPEVVP